MKEFLKMLADFRQRIEKLEGKFSIKSLIFPTDGTLRVPKVSADPAGAADGDIWYNTTSNKYKGKENGTIKTFTTS